MIPGLIVAAPASGSGKTTVTLGLLAAWRAAGEAVAAMATAAAAGGAAVAAAA